MYLHRIYKDCTGAVSVSTVGSADNSALIETNNFKDIGLYWCNA